MTKTLSVIALLVVFTSAISVAQTSQGTFSIGGEIQFSAQKSQNIGVDSKSTSVAFSPDAGYFVIDNLMVGLSLNISGQKNDLGNNNVSKVKSFGLGPYARYYIFTPNDKFAFLAEAGFGFSANKYTPNTGPDTKGSSFNIYASPGFAFFPTPRWGFEITLGLLNFSSSDPNKDADEDKSTNFRFGLTSFSSGLGVRYYFAK